MNEKNDSQLPEWIKVELLSHQASLLMTIQILELYRMSIMCLDNNPDFVQEYIKGLEQNLANTSVQPESSSLFLKQAVEHVEALFIELRARTVVALWGDLEDFILTLLAKWLENEPDAMKLEEVRKLKVELGLYEDLEISEKYSYLIELLEEKLKSKYKKGISRFEHLLAPFNLAGKVDERMRRNIFELQHVRNVLVHRRGITDRRLIEACPWLDLEIGQPLVIDHRTFMNYYSSVMDYSLTFNNRILKHFGLEHSNIDTLWPDFIRERRPE